MASVEHNGRLLYSYTTGYPLFDGKLRVMSGDRPATKEEAEVYLKLTQDTNEAGSDE